MNHLTLACLGAIGLWGLCSSAWAQEPGAATTPEPTAETKALLQQMRTETDEAVAQVRAILIEAWKVDLHGKPEFKSVDANVQRLKDAPIERLAECEMPEGRTRIPGQYAEAFDRAWNHLQGAQARLCLRLMTERQRRLDALSAALQQAVREAERAEELGGVWQAIAAYQELPNVPQVSRALSMPGGNQLETYLRKMEEALRAREQGDYRAMIEALQGPRGTTEVEYLPIGRLMLRIPPFDDFRVRLAGTLQRRIEAARSGVEDALRNRRSPEEFEKALDELCARFGEHQEVFRRMDFDNFDLSHRDDLRRLVQTFQEIAEFLAWLDRWPNVAARRKLPPFPVLGVYDLSPEFRAFLAEQTKRFDELMRNFAADRSVEPATVPSAAQEEQRQALADQRAAFCQEILAVRTPQELLALTEQPPAIFFLQRTPDFGHEDSRGWEPLRGELRYLAALWNDPTGELSGGAHLRNHPLHYHQKLAANDYPVAYESTLQTLRKQIGREVLAKRFKAPQLMAMPLADLPLEKALEQLIAEAKEKGDWRRIQHLLHSQISLEDNDPFRPAIMFPTSRRAMQQQAVDRFIKAMEMVKARNESDAAQGYRAVLSMEGNDIVIKEAIERLRALREKHPGIFGKPLGDVRGK